MNVLIWKQKELAKKAQSGCNIYVNIDNSYYLYFGFEESGCHFWLYKKNIYDYGAYNLTDDYLIKDTFNSYDAYLQWYHSQLINVVPNQIIKHEDSKGVGEQAIFNYLIIN